MPFTPLRTMALASLFLIVALVPLPTSARAATPFTLMARRNSSTPIHVIFDAAFVLALFFAFLGSFSWLATGGTAGAQPTEFFNRLCAVLTAISRQLSAFCRWTFIEGETPTTLNTNNVNAAFELRRGGASYQVATASRGLQGGGPRRVGVNRGSDDSPGGVRPVRAVL